MRQGTLERQGEKLSQRRKRGREENKTSICWLVHSLPLFLSSKLPSFFQNSNQGDSRGSNFCQCVLPSPPDPGEDLETLAKRIPADISKSTGKRKKEKIYPQVPAECVPADTKGPLPLGTLMRKWQDPGGSLVTKE